MLSSCGGHVRPSSQSANSGLPRAAALSPVERDRGARDWEAHLEALPLATWIGDSCGRNVFANQAFRSLLGVTRLDQIADRRWERHIHPDDRASYIRHWDRFISGQGARFKATVRWVRLDTGQTVQLAVRAQKLSSGQFQGWARPAHVEQALARLEELTYVRPR
jgi:PAS domain S-box-containing protein